MITHVEMLVIVFKLYVFFPCHNSNREPSHHRLEYRVVLICQWIVALFTWTSHFVLFFLRHRTIVIKCRHNVILESVLGSEACCGIGI